MRIDTPEISQKNGRHVLSAAISVAENGIHFPKSMWFATNGEDPLFEPGLADAFIAALIPVAMKLGQNVQVNGRVSSRLAYGLDAYQSILNTWWPETFKLVDIHYQELDPRRQDQYPEGVACTFSGGLDSFHAVVEQLPSRLQNSTFNITHALMINGFDQLADLEHRGLAQQMFKTYDPVLSEWGVKLLMIDTNIKQFRDAAMPRQEVVKCYGSSLAASAHALSGVFGRFGIAGGGGYAHSDMIPTGSHPVMDHHLSSDQLQIIFAGANKSRAGKLEMLADIPVVQKHLRVCFDIPEFNPRTGSVINCGECEKCVRTLVGLIIIGKLEKFTAFPRLRPLQQYQRPEILAAIKDFFLEDLAALAQRHDRGDWVNVLQSARQIRREAKKKL
jgi:hypothetical protein